MLSSKYEWRWSDALQKLCFLQFFSCSAGKMTGQPWQGGKLRVQRSRPAKQAVVPFPTFCLPDPTLQLGPPPLGPPSHPPSMASMATPTLPGNTEVSTLVSSSTSVTCKCWFESIEKHMFKRYFIHRAKKIKSLTRRKHWNQSAIFNPLFGHFLARIYSQDPQHSRVLRLCSGCFAAPQMTPVTRTDRYQNGACDT